MSAPHARPPPRVGAIGFDSHAPSAPVALHRDDWHARLEAALERDKDAWAVYERAQAEREL
jgi:hypothetical protein